MGGGLMQLVAYGAQDIYLTGNPQITFFKVVYRRHTNFAVEAIEQTINGSTGLGSKFSVTVARNGDLLSRVYLQMDLDKSDISGSLMEAYAEAIVPVEASGFVLATHANKVKHLADVASARLTRARGFHLVDYVEVEVGGQVIDKHYGEWMAIWCDLTHSDAQKTMLNRMLQQTQGGADRIYVPLQFWFCRNPGLALPLIALQYHEVKFNVKTKDCANSCSTKCNNMSVWCDYIFLDTDERRRFAQVSHEYLIEQLQTTNSLSIAANECNVQADLRFNHPVKELLWVMEKDGCGNGCPTNDARCVDALFALPRNLTERAMLATTCSGTAVLDSADSYLKGHEGLNNLQGVSDSNYERVKTALLQLNGHDRFRRRQGDYFTDVQRYQHHTGGFAKRVQGVPKHVHVYSFALKPEEHQPSGTCNFSRIDNAVLNLEREDKSTAASLRVYATNYNVLRIMSGMGGLAYSN